MSAIDDLINQIPDKGLRERIKKETDRLQHNKKFGLVFEEHLPECTPLYNVKIKVGSKVAVKGKSINKIFKVTNINNEIVTCVRLGQKKEIKYSLSKLVSVAEFGDPIYPYLKKMDIISTAPQSKVWHELIEADNYHALQLLDYVYANKVDCIYIDPPYNTGARDWKYNNDYVDNNDSFRHSKWLSFMEKRLKLAKKLLNPNDSVLIVTIDEKEYIHLGALLEELFPEARIQMVSDLINPTGVARQKEFGRTDEYIFFVKLGNSAPAKLPLPKEWMGSNIRNSTRLKLRWDSLMRTGTGALRKDSANLFYPIFVSTDGTHIIKIGDSLPLNVDKSTVKSPQNSIAIFPIHLNGEEGRWQLSQDTLRQKLKAGYVKLGKFTKRGMAISYLKKGNQQKVEKGDFKIIGHNKDGSIIVDDTDYSPVYVPGTQWQIPSHSAGLGGSDMIRAIFNDKRFTFPKSLYSTHDAIRFFVANKPNALILDFFAGSGTTLHAVNLLNAEDGGHRQCILVTNNEVSSTEAKELTQKGFSPNDKEWQKRGIAQYVTWPRTVCSILGKNINGEKLKGKYVGTNISMSDGFKSNVAYFKLEFLDKNAIALGKQFKELLPILWMKAGSIDKCPEVEKEKLKASYVFTKNHFAVLLDEKAYPSFKEKVNSSETIETVFIVTDSDNGYHEMISNLDVENTYQLYKDYLDNFRINTKG
jgi:adenine-specific DNA-methyltransferase